MSLLNLFKRTPPETRFDGATYNAKVDCQRLTPQTQRVYDAMLDGRWRSLFELSVKTGDPEASVSARLRDLRKQRFGAFVVDRRRRGNSDHGLFEYRLGVKP